jgi:hypothetical protein
MELNLCDNHAFFSSSNVDLDPRECGVACLFFFFSSPDATLLSNLRGKLLESHTKPKSSRLDARHFNIPTPLCVPRSSERKRSLCLSAEVCTTCSILSLRYRVIYLGERFQIQQRTRLSYLFYLMSGGEHLAAALRHFCSLGGERASCKVAHNTTERQWQR